VTSVLQQMQAINSRLARLTSLIQQQGSGPLRIGAEELAALLAELRRIEDLRAGKHDGSDRSLAAAKAEYRVHLENLATLLPRLQARYLAEKAHLEHDQAHVQAASGWAQSQEMLRRR
jgi:hypothetical protein